jgi:hypothetical protein
MPMHAEHAVKSYNFSNYLKQVKKSTRVKIFKFVLEKCKWVQKQPKVFLLSGSKQFLRMLSMHYFKIFVEKISKS